MVGTGTSEPSGPAHPHAVFTCEPVGCKVPQLCFIYFNNPSSFQQQDSPSNPSPCVSQGCRDTLSPPDPTGGVLGPNPAPCTCARGQAANHQKRGDHKAVT